jgi:hypothetical protein
MRRPLALLIIAALLAELAPSVQSPAGVPVDAFNCQALGRALDWMEAPRLFRRPVHANSVRRQAMWLVAGVGLSAAGWLAAHPAAVPRRLAILPILGGVPAIVKWIGTLWRHWTWYWFDVPSMFAGLPPFEAIYHQAMRDYEYESGGDKMFDLRALMEGPIEGKYIGPIVAYRTRLVAMPERQLAGEFQRIIASSMDFYIGHPELTLTLRDWIRTPDFVLETMQNLVQRILGLRLFIAGGRFRDDVEDFSEVLGKAYLDAVFLTEVLDRWQREVDRLNRPEPPRGGMPRFRERGLLRRSA